MRRAGLFPQAARGLGKLALVSIVLAALMLVLPSGLMQTGVWAQVDKKPAAYGAKIWRNNPGEITDSDRERLAKFTAYLGGNGEGGTTSIKKDKAFRKHLKDNGFEYLDSIDNDTGLQVTLVRDYDTGRVFVLPRGTEGVRQSKLDGAQADFGGFYTGQLKIGKAQYESGKKKIADWIQKHKGNIEVIGHSLGGAIAQRIVLDNAEFITSATVFNSPGIELETVSNALSKPSQVRKLMNADGTRKLRIFNVKNDLVGSGGGIMVLGDVIMAEGGALAAGWLAAHTQLIFGPDVKREPMDYARYQAWRDKSGFIVEDVTKDLARAIFNITNFKNPLQNDLRALIGRIVDYENTILRDNDRVKNIKWRKKKDTKPDIGKVVTAAIDQGQLDVEQGRKPPTEKKPKVAKKPAKSPTTPTPTTPPPGDMSGTYAGKLTGSWTYEGDLVWEILDGKFHFVIDGTKVTGSMEGTAKERDKFDIWNVSYMVYAFKGKVSGKYDPKTGDIRAKITGNWTGEGETDIIDEGNFQADRTPDGFTGSWLIQGIGNRFQDQYSGEWTAVAKNLVVAEAPPEKIPEASSWDAYLCKTYPDEWEQMASMGIYCN